MQPSEQTKNDGIIRNLTPEQRAQVDQWVFEERLTDEVVAQRCDDTFSVKMHASSVGRYRRGEQKKRDLDRLMKRAALASAADGEMTDGYEKALQLMSGRALNLVKDSESSTESQRVAAEFMRVVIAGRRETNEARRVAMQRARMEIDVATACLMHQMEIAAIAENEELGEEEQIDAVRKRLFGDELPG